MRERGFNRLEREEKKTYDKLKKKTKRGWNSYSSKEWKSEREAWGGVSGLGYVNQYVGKEKVRKMLSFDKLERERGDEILM